MLPAPAPLPAALLALTLRDVVHVNPVLVIAQLANEVIKDRTRGALCMRNSPELRAAACDNSAVAPYEPVTPDRHIDRLISNTNRVRGGEKRRL